jgi:hypothetical protein
MAYTKFLFVLSIVILFYSAIRWGHKTAKEHSSISTLSIDRPSYSEWLGLCTLYSPSAAVGNQTIDIIFVHGLGGSAIGTWTHSQTKAFWPAWLPKEEGMENIRIMTFGYDSSLGSILSPRNALGVTEFARQLLDSVDLHRRKSGVVVLRSSLCSNTYRIR